LLLNEQAPTRTLRRRERGRDQKLEVGDWRPKEEGKGKEGKCSSETSIDLAVL